MLREITPSNKHLSNTKLYSTCPLLAFLRAPVASFDSAILGGSTTFGTEHNFNQTVNILDTRPTADVELETSCSEITHLCNFNLVTKFTEMH